MSQGEGQESVRVIVHASRPNLAVIGVVLTAACLSCLWLAFAAAIAGSVSAWVILPVAMLGAAGFGTLVWWAFRARTRDEPALILDEAGIYDNFSVVHARRLKWRELNRVWAVGPSWMRMLCIRPENVTPFIEEQSDTRAMIMRLNKWCFDAPVVIPLAALEMPPGDLWMEISRMADAARARVGSSRLAPG